MTPLPKGFPTLVWSKRKPLYRIHCTAHGIWWFASDQYGRMNPVHVDGLGLCYFAEQPIGAFVEVFRTRRTLDNSDITERKLSRVWFGRELRLANACDRRALTFGYTAELGASGIYDYDESQRFASSAAEAGFDGVQWWLRHDPAQKCIGIGLFGPAGPPPAASRKWPKGVTAAIDQDLIDEAQSEFGYRVLPRP